MEKALSFSLQKVSSVSYILHYFVFQKIFCLQNLFNWKFFIKIYFDLSIPSPNSPQTFHISPNFTPFLCLKIKQSNQQNRILKKKKKKDNCSPLPYENFSLLVIFRPVGTPKMLYKFLSWFFSMLNTNKQCDSTLMEKEENFRLSVSY